MLMCLYNMQSVMGSCHYVQHFSLDPSLPLTIVTYVTSVVVVCCLSRRVWDADTCKEVQQLIFETAPSSLNLSANGNIMIITYGQNIAFYNVDT